jgi:hypothetical protein
VFCGCRGYQFEGSYQCIQSHKINLGSAITWPSSQGKASVVAGATHGVSLCCRTFVASHGGSFAGMVGTYVKLTMCPTVLLLLKNLCVIRELGLLLQLLLQLLVVIGAAVAVIAAAFAAAIVDVLIHQGCKLAF